MQRRGASSIVVGAMATGVGAIVSLVGASSIAVVSMVSGVGASALRVGAQAPATFDVGSVKESSSAGRIRAETQPGGRLVVTGMPLRQLVRVACRCPLNGSA